MTGRTRRTGKISKVVRTFGSSWGRISPEGNSRQLFFNVSSLVDPSEFQWLEEGQAVSFEEESDRANESRAVAVTLG